MFSFLGDSESQSDDEPDLTNLIDPMVLLCGLMMLLLPAMQSLQTHDISLPTAHGTELASTETPPIVVTFDANGELFWNDERITQPQLAERLSKLTQGSEVVVAGDAHAEFGHGYDIMALINEAGMSCQGLTKNERNK